MNKKLVVIFIILGLLFAGFVSWKLFFSAKKQQMAEESSQQRLKIVATFYPLAEFAEKVGGEKVEVETLVPTGVEPHDFEPTVRDIELLQNADLIIYNGAGFERWIEKVLPEIDPANKKSLKMSSSISLLKSGETQDPHFWLDPVLAQSEVEGISQKLALLDPVHAIEYRQRADAYAAQLGQLDFQFKQKLSQCQKKTIITSHAAFGYLAKRYGFSVLSIAGLSPDSEPSNQHLAEISQTVKQYGLKYIFFESLVSPKLANTIAQETGAKTLEFNPLEGLTAAEKSQGKDYISIQKQNLENLQLALSCQ